MNKKLIGKRNWLKVSAAAVLSIGVLAGCGDTEDDELDVDVNEPVEDVTPSDETDTNTDMDIEMEDPNVESDVEPDVEPEVESDIEPEIDPEVEPESDLEEDDTK